MSKDITKKADGATAEGGADVQPYRRVDVEGVGSVAGDPEAGTEHENVEKAMEQKGGPHTDTWSGNEGDSLGQHDPVTPDTGDFNTVARTVTADGSGDLGGPLGEAVGEGSADKGGPTWDQSDSGFPDHDPSRVDLLAPLKEEVGERTKTFPADAYHVGEPVTSEGVNDAVGGPIGTGIDAPMKEHHPAIESAFQAGRRHAVQSSRLVEAEVDLGIISDSDKFNRLAELESTPVEQIDATLEAYEKAKSARVKTASTSVTKSATRLPSFSKIARSPEVEIAPNWNPEDSIY